MIHLMHRRWLLLCISLIHCTYLLADIVTLRNTTTVPIFAATYYVEGKSNDGEPGATQRISNAHFIAPMASKKIERPAKKSYQSRSNKFAIYDRDVYISPNKDQLTATLPKNSLPFFNIGNMEGSEFTIGLLGTQVIGFSDQNSDYITLHNETDKDIFAAVYYLEGRSSDQKIGNAFRFNNIISIPPNSALKLLRPPRRCRYYINNVCSNFEDRDLYVSHAQDDLGTVIPKGSRAAVNIGTTQGSEFYITQEDGRLKGYNLTSWATRPISKAVKKTFEQIKNIILDPLRKKFQDHPYATKQASTRTGNDIAPQEKAYLDKRLPRVKQTLEKVLVMKIADDEVPHIAICASGGGYRAAISTLGFFSGADEFDLLNCCVYSAGISGSTWAIAGWIQSDMPIKQYIDQVAKQSTKLFTDLSGVAQKQIQTVLLKKAAFGQSISMLDVFGTLLAQKFLKNDNVDNPQAITLNDQASQIQNGTKFFPLYTAFIDQQPYVYVEFTPYEVGSAATQIYVPSWSLGRTFNAGVSQNFAPPLSLGFFLGVCGSAMSANIKDILNAAKMAIEGPLTIFGMEVKANVLINLLDHYAKKVPQITAKRGSSAQVSNWMFGMPNPWQFITELTLVDAGVALNIPIPPLLQSKRDASILLVFDASVDTKNAPELRVAEEYAKTHGLKFPKIDYTQVNTICSVHQDDDPTVPTVIYMPLMPNKNYEKGWDPKKEDFTSTFNFVYTKEQIQKLSGLTRANMLESKKKIIDTIRSVIEKKRRIT